jgi:hypothetical protein
MPGPEAIPTLPLTCKEPTTQRLLRIIGGDSPNIDVRVLASPLGFRRASSHGPSKPGRRSTLGRPSRLPFRRAFFRPSNTRSRIRSRSNSATAARTVMSRRPMGVVVSSSGWLTQTKPTPRASHSFSVFRHSIVERQLVGGNQLTRLPLPPGISDRVGVWRLERDEGWRRPLHGGHSSRSH